MKAMLQIISGLRMRKLRLGNSPTISLRDRGATQTFRLALDTQASLGTPLRAIVVRLVLFPRHAICPRSPYHESVGHEIRHPAHHHFLCTGSRLLLYQHAHQAYISLHHWLHQSHFLCRKLRNENIPPGRLNGGHTTSYLHLAS
jgi:hypothetical protein